MNILARLIRLVFWLVIVSWGIGLLRRVAAWIARGSSANFPGQQASAQTVDIPGTSRRLVHDPVCGMHLAEVLAIPARKDGELMYFCSAECRDKFLAAEKKAAAAGG
jgi:YHS domain-containing protein